MLIRLLRNFLRPYASQVAVVVALLVVQTVGNLYLPNLNADIINNGVVKGNIRYILTTGGVMLAIALVLGVVAIIAVYWASRVSMGAGADMRAAVFTCVQGLSAGEINRFGTPSLITRNTNDIQQIQLFLQVALTLMVIAPIMCVGGVFLAIKEGAALSPLLAVAVPVMALVIGVVLVIVVPQFRSIQVKIDRINLHRGDGHAFRAARELHSLPRDRRLPAGRGCRGVSFGGPRGGMRRGGGPPAEWAKDLRGTLRRLLTRLRPERIKLVIALLLGVTSVAFIVSGPRILGNATNVLFNGVVGKLLKAGSTKAQAIALLRAHGQGQIANMVSGMNITPGRGVDLTELGKVLGLAALVYLLGAAFNYGQGYTMAGVAQRTMFGLRREVEEKLGRLPLRYFDSHPHGDILRPLREPAGERLGMPASVRKESARFVEWRHSPVPPRRCGFRVLVRRGGGSFRIRRMHSRGSATTTRSANWPLRMTPDDPSPARA
jgi:ABC-type multidrug transport system fused ATPase/permease subunit